jgi:hypothetical protein
VRARSRCEDRRLEGKEWLPLIDAMRADTVVRDLRDRALIAHLHLRGAGRPAVASQSLPRCLPRADLCVGGGWAMGHERGTRARRCDGTFA